MFDVTALFDALRKSSGLEGVVFLLLVITGMLISGVLRPKGNVEAELKAREEAHRAQLESRDRQIAELLHLYDRLSEKMDRQQDLFGESLRLIEREMLPVVRQAVLPPAARQGFQ